MLLVVVLYVALAHRGLSIALNTRDRFAALAALGITTWITVQASVHIGASLMLIPTTGQPLPFMSYGGSSLLSHDGCSRLTVEHLTFRDREEGS